jgi:hypothetical protein
VKRGGIRRRTADPDTLESWLASDRPEKQSLADEVLVQLGEEKALLFLLSTIYQEEKWRKKRGLLWYLTLISAVMAVNIVLIKMGTHFSLAGMCGGFAGQAVQGAPPSQQQKACIRRLCSLCDRRTVPVLLDMLAVRHNMEHEAIARSLIQILPQLEQDDLAALSKTQRTTLYSALRRKRSGWIQQETRRELARSLLMTFTRLEHVDALRDVQKVAALKVKNPEDQALRQTAMNCLPLLERAAKEHNLVAVCR